MSGIIFKEIAEVVSKTLLTVGMTMAVLLAPSLVGATLLVDMQLCKDSDYTPGERWCDAGQKHGRAVVSQRDVKSMYFFTKLKAEDVDEVIHVWVRKGDTMGMQPTYYIQGAGYQDSTREIARALKLDNGNSGELVSAVQLLVRPSPGYRTRSSMTVGPWSKGDWEVRVYNGDYQELGRREFSVE